MIVDLGYFPLKAFARLATAGAYFFSRRNPQTTLLTTAADRWHPVDLAHGLTTVEGQLLERAICLGENARVASRLMASRVPAAIVNERRRHAKKTAQQKGYTPATAHLTLLAWNLLMTNVPPSVWTTDTIGKVYPVRWPSERIVKSWKSDLH